MHEIVATVYIQYNKELWLLSRGPVAGVQSSI